MNILEHINDIQTNPKKYSVILLYRKNFDEVLLQKKNRGPWYNIGTWNGVGGEINENETPLDGAYREVFEETGIHKVDIHNLELLTIEYLPINRLRDKDCLLYIYFGLLKEQGRPNFVQKEDEELKWHNAEFYVKADKVAGHGAVQVWNTSIQQIQGLLEKDREELPI